MSTPLTINSVETLQEALPLIRASQEAYSNFTQEQVDAICEKTAMAVSKMRIPLAKMACEETGYGIVVDKVTKNQYASEHIWNYMRNKKTCGIISEDRAFGVKKIASPKGVIAAITPHHEPHFHHDLQDHAGAEDPERHHPLPSPPCGKLLHRRSEDHAGCRH